MSKTFDLVFKCEPSTFLRRSSRTHTAYFNKYLPKEMNPKLILLLLQVLLADGNTNNEMKLPLVTLNSIRSRKTRTYLIKIDEDDALLKSQPFVKVSSGEWVPVYRNLPANLVESSGQHHEDHHDNHDEEQEHGDHHAEHTTDREAYNIWWWTLVLNGSLFIIVLVVWVMKRLVSSELSILSSNMLKFIRSKF